MRNCLDFGWRSRHLQKNGSLARTCDNGARTCPAPQVVCIFLSPRRPPIRTGRGARSRNAQRSRRVATDPSTRMLEREDL
jgi:hypothetical protein